MDDAAGCGLVLLAAGASSRMGRPKQLLPVGGKPLLRRVAEAAVRSAAAPVIVVLGANADAVLPSVEGLGVRVVVNPQWQEGIGSSIRAGMKELLEVAPGSRGVVVALGDQPNFSEDHVARILAEQARGSHSMVASECGGELMPPAFFAPEHFAALLSLRGDTGARSLFRAHSGRVAAVKAADLLDLDTRRDYEEYLRL